MKTILIFRTSTTGTWREKLAGVSAFAKTKGWRLQAIDARPPLSPNLNSLIAFWAPSGIILDASGDTNWLDPTILAHLPCVSMTPSSDVIRHTFPSVRSSCREIATIAITELLRRNINSLAFIDAPGKPIWSTEKREAFRDIAQLHGFTLSVPLSANELSELDKPIGLFAATDFVAAEVLSLVGHLGLSVPDDLSIVGFDDDPEICENCVPTLTSIRPDFHQLGFIAAQKLDEQIATQRRKVESVEIPPIEIVHRASSYRHMDLTVRRALEQIRLHACEGYSVADIAALFGDCSRRTAELRFKAETGKTMTEALLDIRLAHARDYLKEGEVAISAIANFCGWKSDIAFRKAFKHKFGILPTHFRKKTTKP